MAENTPQMEIFMCSRCHSSAVMPVEWAAKIKAAGRRLGLEYLGKYGSEKAQAALTQDGMENPEAVRRRLASLVAEMEKCPYVSAHKKGRAKHNTAGSRRKPASKNGYTGSATPP